MSSSAVPSSTTIYSGSVKAGDARRLAADDGAFFEVSSTTSGTRITSWYGRIKGVPNELTKLSVTYRGSNSAACNQTVYLWHWGYGFWVRFSSSSVSPAKSEVSFSPTSSIASYVSGTSGDGDVAVRVHCTRAGMPGFTTAADLMRVDFTEPA